MHKRVGSNKHWFDHDDRGGESERHVSFKRQLGPNISKSRRAKRNFEKKFRTVFLDDDNIYMVANDQGQPRNQFQNNKRRGGQRMSRDSPGHRMRRLQDSNSSWYKVNIQKGAKYEKDYLYQILLNYIKPVPLIPYGFSKQGDDISFFVDNFETGQKLLSADRRITANDGWKLSIHVRPNFPNATVDSTLKEKIKFVMSKRYNIHTKALDLSKFHGDADFMREDLLIALSRVHLLAEVINIIIESIPDLVALDLSHNKISSTEPLKNLVDKTPNLKILHLGNNLIRSVHYFEALKTMPIEELVLDGNPLCDKYNHQDVYVRDVRKRFPKIVKLDGVILPREISFDLEETHKLKPSQGSFLCDPAGGTIVRQFLEQYYTLYDSNSRTPLIEAYREDAVFSMTAKSLNSLSGYASDSRNLNLNPRGKNGLLRRGRASIIPFIDSLPRTQHDPASFAVDLSFFTPKLIVLSICGVFREVGSKLPMRAFSRAFIIVPAGAGFCIVNDMLHICLATSDQVKEAFKTSPGPSEPTAPPVVAPPVVAPPMPVVVSPDAELVRRQQMVNTFALQSNMNISWAEKCLNETNWDYDRALYVFTELQKQGTIPAEAFIK